MFWRTELSHLLAVGESEMYGLFHPRLGSGGKVSESTLPSSHLKETNKQTKKLCSETTMLVPIGLKFPQRCAFRRFGVFLILVV